MKLKKIRALSMLMSEMKLHEIQIEQNGTKLTLKNLHLEKEKVNTMLPLEDTLNNLKVTLCETGVETISSPMVGVFYASPSIDNPPFVSIGHVVKTGDVLCIVESMKLMNEIVAEKDGIITKIFPNSGDIVEFGQPLFEMKGVD
jgi:acetyl-CoA carboxylase biotin carboxyl carrier protein